MAQTGFIKFDPVKITDIASNLALWHGTFTRSMADIQNYSYNLYVSWKSDGGADEYFKKHNELTKQGEDLARLLEVFSDNLYKVARVYIQGEQDAEKKVETLPISGVFGV